MLSIDEIDALVGATLISVLRQLRANCDRRPTHFPQSVLLCGLRNVRVYRFYSSREGTNVHGGSAFSMKAESLRLGDLSRREVEELLAAHTRETSQSFGGEAIERIREFTQGQPWLVNALAYQACFRDRSGRDRSRMIGVEDIVSAREALILRRVTHLDQLVDKLRERRVQRVVEPILSGGPHRSYSFTDLEYVRDLGLVALDDPPRIANPIYAEVVPRELTAALQSSIMLEAVWHVRVDGSLDSGALMKAFQD